MTIGPASKDEWVTVSACKVKIDHAEKEIQELKNALKDLRKEKTENKRYINNRRLAIYLGIVSLTGSFWITLFFKLFEFFFG